MSEQKENTDPVEYLRTELRKANDAAQIIARENAWLRDKINAFASELAEIQGQQADLVQKHFWDLLR